MYVYRIERKKYLGASPGESVEQPALGLAVVLVEAVPHDADDNLVGDKLSLRKEHQDRGDGQKMKKKNEITPKH